MTEPKSPAVLVIEESSYPALLLESDEGIVHPPHYAILRHRHLQIPEPGMSAPVAAPVYNIQETRMDSMREHRHQSPLPVSSRVSSRNNFSPATATSASPSHRIASNSIATRHATYPRATRHDHAIRGRGEKIVWYLSNGDSPLSVPPTVLAQSGELFLHNYNHNSRQIWIRTPSLDWTLIDEGYPHPDLDEYVLHLSNGEPRWVTKETMRTYKGREKKRERNISTPSRIGTPGLPRAPTSATLQSEAGTESVCVLAAVQGKLKDAQQQGNDAVRVAHKVRKTVIKLFDVDPFPKHPFQDNASFMNVRSSFRVFPVSLYAGTSLPGPMQLSTP
ncbi:hypothetical protein A0H81_09431 [Grifola frondosa]|uniref:Uncharacterized protein n=1 Tax=Grifola frondosa TaxID=5627 RepID=A0A1C7M2R3_GRIFR|nr:hypothetical protein A0H81_09431 [Grifola frondosa]